MSRRPIEIVVPMILVLAFMAAYFLVVLPRTLVDEGTASLLSGYDLSSYFLPRYWLGSSELSHAELPLWNRFEFGGIPLLATAQPAALYPPKIALFGLLAPAPAYWAFLLFHYALAAFAFFRFLESEGIQGAGLFAGTAAWIFSASVLSSNYHPVRIACLAWVPVIFALATRIVAGETGLRTLALLALAVALQLLAGYPEATIDVGLLLAVHATVRWFQGRAAIPPWKTVPLLGATFLLGAAAAGLQLVPLAELATVARRADFADQWTETANRAMALLAQRPNDLVFAREQRFLPGLVIFGLVGFVLSPARSAALGLCTCLAFAAGGWRWLRLLPGLRLVRFPLTWLVLAVFFFAWAVGFGCDAVSRADALGPRLRQRALALVPVVTVVTIGAWLVAWRPAATSAAPHGRPAPLAFFAGSPTALGLSLLSVLGVVALCVLARRGTLVPPWAWLSAVGLAVTGHLAAYPYGAQRAPFAPPFPAGVVASMHGQPREIHGRVLAPADLPFGYEITDGLPSALGVEVSFLPFRWATITEWLGLKGGSLVRSMDWKAAAAARGLWNALDVEFFGAPLSERSLLVSQGARKVAELGDLGLFENPGRMGYAWVNYAVHRVGSEREALEYVTKDRFDPDREVVLEEPTVESFPATTAEDVTVPSSGRRFSSTEVELDVDLPRPGVLVVSESAYPGWMAFVDGVRRPWLTADYVLRGVELDRGPHRVRFEYHPASVLWGALSSGIGLAAIVAMLALGRRRPPGSATARALSPVLLLLLVACNRSAAPPEELAMVAKSARLHAIARAAEAEKAEKTKRAAEAASASPKVEPPPPVTAFRASEPSALHSPENSDTCALDRIGHKAATDLQTVERLLPVPLLGWATDGATGTVPPVILLELEGARRFYAVAPRRMFRPDVAESFKQPAFKDSGYEALVSFRAVDPGEYSINVLQVTTQGTALVCGTRRRISVH